MSANKTIYILGIDCRTNHADSGKDIGALWQRAGEQNILGQSQDAWAVYNDYELSDGGFAVQVTVGVEVPEGTEVPDGRVLVKVPAQKWHHVQTNGTIPAVQQAWADVWGRWPDGGPRTFIADTEHWKMGATGPVSADVRVGIRA